MNRKLLLLILLSAGALGAWKAGSPSRAPSTATSAPNPPVDTAETATGYGTRKDAKCCDTPPSKAALLQKP